MNFDGSGKDTHTHSVTASNGGSLNFKLINLNEDYLQNLEYDDAYLI